MRSRDASPTRHLQLPGTYNLRDIGGYATADGRVTRWRTLMRGDSLHRLTDEGQATLIKAGLRTVVDLRRDSELARAPNVFAASANVRYLNVPLLDDPPDASAALPTLAGIYARILEEAHAQIRAIFAALAEPEAFPALVHCTAGKDRTGIVVALLLGNSGVATATIAADYALTETYLAGEFVEDLKRRVIAAGEDWAAYAPLMGSPEALMLQTLTGLEERHGGIRPYLRAIGVPEAHLNALRVALVE